MWMVMLVVMNYGWSHGCCRRNWRAEAAEAVATASQDHDSTMGSVENRHLHIFLYLGHCVQSLRVSYRSPRTDQESGQLLVNKSMDQAKPKQNTFRAEWLTSLSKGFRKFVAIQK